MSEACAAQQFIALKAKLGRDIHLLRLANLYRSEVDETKVGSFEIRRGLKLAAPVWITRRPIVTSHARPISS
jgi:hypothetical protein